MEVSAASKVLTVSDETREKPSQITKRIVGAIELTKIADKYLQI